MKSDSLKRRSAISILFSRIVICIVLASLSLALAGCNEAGEVKKKQQEYRTEWQEIMGRFQVQVNADDQKANALVKKNDISGLIALIKAREANVDLVMGQILKLYPPDDLRKLHATTLFYLTSLKDQLDAQNSLNEAVLSSAPTGDLKTVAENAAAKTQEVGREIGVEIQKLGIKLKPTQGETKTTPAPSSPGQTNSGASSKP